MSVPTLSPIAARRADFPVLAQTVYGRPLVYLDNAATTQKPQVVIDRMMAYYTHENANIHRGVHFLSQQGTDAYEAARARVQRFLGAASDREIIFTRGCTESINLVAAAWGRTHMGPGDEVLLTGLEHHSNIVPWQLLCAEKGAKLRVVPVNEAGEVEIEAFRAALTDRTRIAAFAHVSNALGTILPVAEMVAAARAAGAVTLIDGAQAAPHISIDVQALGADFYAFSGHKVFGPTGIGVLYGRVELLEAMPPYQGGGDMIEEVHFSGSTWSQPPQRFEAGTPHIAGAIGLAAALEYIDGIGLEAIAAYEDDLLAYATGQVAALGGVRFIGTAREKTGVLSLLLDGIHPYDAGTILDRLGIAVRTGHHCAQPLMERFDIPGTLRASFAFYNTREDVDAFVAGLERARAMLG